MVRAAGRDRRASERRASLRAAACGHNPGRWVSVCRASPEARVPGFGDVPKSSPRRAVARPTKVLATGCVGAGNNPRGSGTARRLRSWIRTHESPRDWMRRGWKQPPWVGHCPTPAFLDSARCPRQRSVERCSTHEGPSRLEALALETTPVGRALPDACVPGFVDAPKPSQRRAIARPTNNVASPASTISSPPRAPCRSPGRWPPSLRPCFPSPPRSPRRLRPSSLRLPS